MRARHSLALLSLLSLASLSSVAGATEPTATSAPAPVELSLHGKAGKLQAWLWRPSGPGPFPVIVYNHGSERDPVAGTLPTLGPFFVSHGYAVVFPYRRGAGKSEGTFWQDVADKQPESEQLTATIKQLVLSNDDIVTAIEWTRTQPWAQRDRINVAGCSFGGIETLLTAERAIPGLRAAVDFAGASMSWADNPRLQERLLHSVEAAKVPVFFVQAQNDFNTAPSTILSEAMRAKKLPYRVHIFPPFGTTPQQGHGMFCMRGMGVWGDEVLQFLRDRR
jgi:carboxymethylenebutenolidase